MNISNTITITASSPDLGRLAALAERSKDKATFVSEDKVLDGLVKTFMTARPNRPIAIDHDDFLVYGRCVVEIFKQMNDECNGDSKDRDVVGKVIDIYARLDF